LDTAVKKRTGEQRQTINPVDTEQRGFQFQRIQLNAWACELQLASLWKIARTGAVSARRTVIVELTDSDVFRALGEAAPSSLYG
jgi:hypothetical protein